MTLYEIIEEAFEQCGIESKEGYDMRTARRSLMLVLKRWQNRQVNFWQMTEYLLNCSPGVKAYPLGEETIDLPLASVCTVGGPEINLGRQMSFSDYHNLPNKEQPGRPTNFFVHREAYGPTLYLWPVPNSSNLQIKGFRLRGDSLKNPDGTMMPYDQSVVVPERFEPALIAALAAEIAKKKVPDRAPIMAQYAQEQWAEAERGDSSRSSVFIVPELAGTW